MERSPFFEGVHDTAPCRKGWHLRHTVDGDPFFMLAIRHTDTPLKTLRDAQFNTVWFPNDAAPASLTHRSRR